MTAVPYVFPDFYRMIEPVVLPWVFPFVQVGEKHLSAFLY
jgi:hypothetical protein